MGKLREKLDTRVAMYKQNLESCSYVLISKCDQCGFTYERLIVADFDNHLPDRLEIHLSEVGRHECEKDKIGSMRSVGVRRLKEDD